MIWACYDPQIMHGLVCILLLANNPNPWDEVQNDDGIRLLLREVPESSLREVKAVTVIAVPAANIWAVVNDQAHYAEFMPHVVAVEILGDAGARARYEYHVIDPPIVDRRDYTLRVTLDANPAAGLYRRSWSCTRDEGPPPRDGVVRVSVCRGYWLIERLSDDTARVTYWLHTDPGGSIPSWMVNRANTTSIPNMIRAVRNRSLDPGWRRD